MSQVKNVKLFESILGDFHRQGILQSFILIGSWVLRVYAEHYDHNPQIPIVSTQDLDLLVENPPRIKKEVNVAELLEKYELEASFSPTAFVLMKYLLIKKRKTVQMLKIQKDISTARDLELFLLEQGYEEDIKLCYHRMPKKWRQSLLSILMENNSELYNLLADN